MIVYIVCCCFLFVFCLFVYVYRLSCQVTDSTSLPGSPTSTVSPGEALSKRCITIIKTALKPDIWPSESILFTKFTSSFFKLHSAFALYTPSFFSFKLAVRTRKMYYYLIVSLISLKKWPNLSKGSLSSKFRNSPTQKWLILHVGMASISVWSLPMQVIGEHCIFLDCCGVFLFFLFFPPCWTGMCKNCIFLNLYCLLVTICLDRNNYM